MLQYKFNLLTNSIIVKNAVLQPSCESELKHNHHLFFSDGDKGASNTTALIEANVSAQCERPYLELLGSKGKRKRHRVKQRGRQGGGTDKYVSNIY